MIFQKTDIIIIFKFFLEDNMIIEEYNLNFSNEHGQKLKLSEFLNTREPNLYIYNAFNWYSAIKNERSEHESVRFWGNLDSEWKAMVKKIM